MVLALFAEYLIVLIYLLVFLSLSRLLLIQYIGLQPNIAMHIMFLRSVIVSKNRILRLLNCLCKLYLDSIKFSFFQQKYFDFT